MKESSRFILIISTILLVVFGLITAIAAAIGIDMDRIFTDDGVLTVQIALAAFIISLIVYLVSKSKK